MPTFSGLPEQITVDKDKYDELQAELDQPITEHPDVQRLIGQVVELQAEVKRLKKDMNDAGLMTKEEFEKWLTRS